MASFSSSFAIIAPVFSTIDGKAIRFPDPCSLEFVCNTLLDMILLEPVDWHAVQICMLSTIKQVIATEHASCEILNFGPGYGMSKSKHNWPTDVQVLDASSANFHPLMKNTSAGLSRDDIAIVGMGVDLPGAPDAATLWKNLSGGVSSCTEVRI